MICPTRKDRIWVWVRYLVGLSEWWNVTIRDSESKAVLDIYEKQGIRNGHPQNKMNGPAFKTELATAYPDCRLVVTMEMLTVEGMIKIVYVLLKGW